MCEESDPWTKISNIYYTNEYDNDTISTDREHKVICYEDIRLYIVQNLPPKQRDLLEMEIKLTTLLNTRES